MVLMIVWISGCAVWLSLVIAVAPRVFRFFDVRLVRRRLTLDDVLGTPAVCGVPTRSPINSRIESRTTSRRTAHSAPPMLIAEHCRTAARRIGSGIPAAHALSISARALAVHSTSWTILADQLDDHLPLETALDGALRHATGHDAHAVSMLAAATVERHLPAAALDHVAHVLEESSALANEATVAAGHATYTARMLTWLPIVVLTGGFVVSDSLRTSRTSMAVIVPIASGVLLNLLGRLAIARAVAATVHLDNDDPDSPARIADSLAASLAAGLPVHSACARLETGAREEDVRTHVARALSDGTPLIQALAPLSARPECTGIAEVVIAIAHDGVAGAQAATLLADHARAARRTRTRSAIAALPASLSVPVTMLLLPAFIVGAVVPVVAAGSGSFRPHVDVVATQR